MKKLIVLLPFLILCISSCKKETSAPTPPSETMPPGCRIQKFKTTIGTYTFEYDTKGRIKKQTDDLGYYTTFEYGAGTLVITDYSKTGTKLEQETATLNAFGYIENLTDEDGAITTASYTADGYLTLYEERDEFNILQLQKRYTIENGNATKMMETTRYGTVYDSVLFTYFYLPTLNKGGIGSSDYNSTWRSFTKPYKNLLYEIRRKGAFQTIYIYQFDTDSLPKQIEKSGTMGLEDSYYYNFTCN